MAKRPALSRVVIPLTLLAVFLAVVGGSFAALTLFDGGQRTGRCTASGLSTSHSYSTEQTLNAATISAVSIDMGLPPRAASIALATAYQESKLKNIDYGDRDSVGLFQQRPSQGWGTKEQIMDPVFASTAFYEKLAKVKGYENMDITVAAQKVQRSAFPDAYADHEVEGRLFSSALTGNSGPELECDLAAAGGPAHPEKLRESLAHEFTRLSKSGEVESTLGAAGSNAPQGAGHTTVVIKTADEKRGWALANWAVAHAAQDNIVGVDYRGHRWDRSRHVSQTSSQWDSDATGGAGSDDDAVVIYLAKGA